jgi:hypothetical protein
MLFHDFREVITINYCNRAFLTDRQDCAEHSLGNTALRDYYELHGFPYQHHSNDKAVFSDWVHSCKCRHSALK